MRTALMLARYEVLTPVAVLFALAGFGSAALAADHVVATGVVDTDSFPLAPGDSLTNNGTITNQANNTVPAVFVNPAGNISFILNSSTGTITGINEFGIGINGSIGTFTNNGIITGDMQAAGASGNVDTFVNTGSMTSSGGRAFGLNGNMLTFTNSGTLSGQSQGFGSAGTIGTFTNSGTISGVNETGVGISGNVTTFTNTGAISSTNETGVALSSVGTLTNSGSMIGQHNGFSSNGIVGSFTNSGTIKATTFSGAFFAQNVGTFVNSGAISSTNRGGVAFDAAVTEFRNSGQITGAREGIFSQGGFGSFSNLVGGTIIGQSENGFSSEGPLGTFTNAGTILGARFDAVFLRGVTTFTNESTGVIRNTDGLGTNGNGVGVNTSATNGGVVGSFVNRGTISGDLNSDSTGVGFFDGGNNDAQQVGSFLNSGSISGRRNGVIFDGGVGTFTNEAGGTISGRDNNGVYSAAAVTSFSNAGLISSQFGTAIAIDGVVGTFANSGTARSNTQDGIYFDKLVTTFNNSGAVEANTTGVEFNAGVTSFTNSGRITTHEHAAVFINGNVGSFQNLQGGFIQSSGGALLPPNAFNTGVAIIGQVNSLNNAGFIGGDPTGSGIFIRGGGTITNSGTIQGSEGITFDSNVPGSGTVINSGTITSLNGWASINFAQNNNFARDDRLTLLTGSRLFGDVEFGAGNDTFDFSQFSGNQLVSAFNVETVIAGETLFFRNGDQFAIFDESGLYAPSQQILDVVTEIKTSIRRQLRTFGQDDLQSSTDALNYAARPALGEAAMAAGDLTYEDHSSRVWGSVFGGGGGDNSAARLSNLYGGLVAGAHAQFAPDFTVGLVGSYAASRFSVANGPQTVNSQTGAFGIYGEHDAGVVELEFSLIGGGSAHQSAREVIAQGQTQTASASFSSFFIAPTIGAAMPVLETETGEVRIAGSLTYIGGRVSGYTETGSAMNLVVGDQSISMLEARFGLEGEAIVGTTEAGDVKVFGEAGVLLEANLGTSTTPVTFFGQTVNAVTAGTQTFGAYGGFGIEAAVGNSVSVFGGVDGAIRSDGFGSASAKVGVNASF